MRTARSTRAWISTDPKVSPHDAKALCSVRAEMLSELATSAACRYVSGQLNDEIANPVTDGPFDWGRCDLTSAKFGRRQGQQCSKLINQHCLWQRGLDDKLGRKLGNVT